MTESHLQAALLLEAPKRFPDLRLFRRNVLAVRIQDRSVRAGIAGQADLYGIVRGGGHIEIELKGVSTSTSPEQKAWAAWCKEWGIPYVLLRAKKNEATRETIERWCGELRTALASAPLASVVPRTIS